MDRDATFLLSLVTFAVAACAVGVCGWIVWSRSRPAADAAVAGDPAAATNEHPDVPEES